MNVHGLNPAIAYDGRSMIFSGQREILLSGTVHYPRVHPSEWGTALDRLKGLGLNTVQTYVFWNFHETVQGNWVWTGASDLAAFLTAAQQRGLYAVVRLGPYVDAEWSDGGLPPYLRDLGAACYRCTDPVWEANMARFLSTLVNYTRPMFYPNGPVIDLQVENEYNGQELTYLNWAVDTARSFTTDIPWNLCHDQPLCAQVNNGTVGGKALCTINGFWCEQTPSQGFVSQPSPVWVYTQRKNNPAQPIAWTEDQSWFNQWGTAHRIRHSQDQAYGILRWFAYGGTWHNHYTITGGNNYGLTAGWGTGPVATAYTPDSVIDSFLLRHEPRYTFYAAMYNTLQEYADDLLDNPIPNPQPLGPMGTELHTYGFLAFLSNMNTTVSFAVSYQGRSYYLTNWTVVLVDIPSGKVLFNTSSVQPSDEVPTGPQPTAAGVGPTGGWSYYAEACVACGVKSFLAPAGEGAPEQTRLTGLDLTGQTYTSDYAVYSTDVPSEFLLSGASGPLRAPVNVNTRGGEYVYIYLDGQPVNATSDTAFHVGAAADAPVLSSAATHRLDIVVNAMGMTNVDPSPSTGKGVRNATVNGNNVSLQAWNVTWLYPGESLAIFTAAGTNSVQWNPVSAGVPSVNASLFWLRGYFNMPPVDPSANQTAFALNMTGLIKGHVWFNGFHLGRYNLQTGSCEGDIDGDCAPPYHGSRCYEYWYACSKPTQTLYHVPAPLVQATGNLVVIFEESSYVSGTSPRDVSTVQLVTLHDHPYGGG